MKTEDIDPENYQPWMPEVNPVRLAIYGKTIEETSELNIELVRCVIQGLDEINPSTGESNREGLQNELADVENMIDIIRTKFNLEPMNVRRRLKRQMQDNWHRKIGELALKA